MDDNLRLIIPCPGCKKRIPRGLYKYKVTESDPLAQKLYCPDCDVGFNFMDLSDAEEHEER